jgi:hypothetical protein
VRDDGPGLDRLVRPVVAIGNFDGSTAAIAR